MASGVDTALTVGGVAADAAGCMADSCGWAGVKLFADGALGSRGAWLQEPYSDAPGTSGRRVHDDDELQESDEPRGDGRFPGRGPRDRRQGQRQVLDAIERAGAYL